MNRLLAGLFCFICAISMQGCIPIPVPKPGTQDPFNKELIFIRPGITSRVDVLARLSNPYQKRLGDKFFAYVGYETNTGLCFLNAMVILIGPTIPCIAGGKAHFIGIDFDDNGRVRQVNRAATGIIGSKDIPDSSLSVTTWKSCLPSGICFDSSSEMITAAPDQDAKAKRFDPVAQSCSIYIIGAASSTPIQFTLNLDGQDGGRLGSGTYMLWTPPPGRHQLFGKLLQSDTTKERLASLSLQCEPSGLMFVQAKSNGNLDILPDVEGRKAVRASTRLLDAL